MGYRSKKASESRGAPRPESITITIVPKRDTPDESSPEHDISVGMNNKQTSLLLKRGECVNFDVCASDLPNSGYELTTNDFDICLDTDKLPRVGSGPGMSRVEKPPAAQPIRSSEALQQAKPFSDSAKTLLSPDGTDNGSAEDELSSLPVPEQSRSGAVKSLTAKLAQLIGIEKAMERPEKPGAAGRAASRIAVHSKKRENGAGQVGSAEATCQAREGGVFDEVLIKPSTVSDEYARRLSSICAQLFNKSNDGISGGAAARAGPVTEYRGKQGVRVKELISTVFTPKEAAPRVISKIVIPERSIPFETLIKIYESR